MAVVADLGLDDGPGQECPDLMETRLENPMEGKVWQSGLRCCCGPGAGKTVFVPVDPSWIVGTLSGCMGLPAC